MEPPAVVVFSDVPGRKKHENLFRADIQITIGFICPYVGPIVALGTIAGSSIHGFEPAGHSGLIQKVSFILQLRVRGFKSCPLRGGL
jgi:hypothetical protein